MSSFIDFPHRTGHIGQGTRLGQGTVLRLDKLIDLRYNIFGDKLCQDKQEKRVKQEYTT